MIKPIEMKRFLKKHVVPELAGFYLHKNDMVLRVSSIFFHGFYFQRSLYDDDFYVTRFVSFLPDGTDFLGMIVEDRIAREDRPDKHTTMFRLDNPEQEAEQIFRSLRADRLYRLTIRPTCRSVLDALPEGDYSVWVHFGLACCAIMEGETDRAARELRKFMLVTEWLKDDWASEPRELVETLLSRASNDEWCRGLLWKRAEAGVRLKKLEKIAELSGWRPGT